MKISKYKTERNIREKAIRKEKLDQHNKYKYLNQLLGTCCT